MIFSKAGKKNLNNKKRPLVWAHRGASGYAPENTLESFKKAIEMHADGIELDVQLTKDDELVVIHDEEIDRTSNGSGWVKDLTLRQLRKYNYNKTCPKYRHADIPTLKEVYELIKPSGLTINVEIKSGVIFYPEIEEKVLRLTKEMGMEDRVIYSSFNHYTCKHIHELNPEAYVGFLYSDGPIDVASYCKANGGSALHPALYNLQYPDYMKKAADNGLDVNVWTVNKKEYMQMCCDMGVNAIITNYPDKALKIISKNL